MVGDPRANNFRMMMYIFSISVAGGGAVAGVSLGIVAAIAAFEGYTLATAYAVAATVAFAISALFIAIPPFVDTLSERMDITTSTSTTSEPEEGIQGTEPDVNNPKKSDTADESGTANESDTDTEREGELEFS